MERVRSPAVAGTFYPGESKTLAVAVASLLEDALALSEGTPKALIAPHAGYVYSGPIAAHAYACLRNARHRIRRVVLLGPSHRTYVHGLAVPSVDAFSSPLGPVTIDRDALGAVADLPQVVLSDDAHAVEHSLEVHLPFLQTVLNEFRLVPFSVGEATANEVAEVLERLWGGDETLIVVSSDLSHYLPYGTARRVDRETVDAMLRLDPSIEHERACGATPVNGLLLAAGRHGLQPRLLDLRSSGDTAGDTRRVVGYCAIAFDEGRAP